MKRVLFVALLIAIVIVGVGFVVAGRLPGPVIEIRQPGKTVGLATPMDVAIQSPHGQFDSVEAYLEQKDKRYPLFSLAEPTSATVQQENTERIVIRRPIGKRAIPELTSGPARLVVTASRKVLFGLRNRETTVARDIQMRFERPRLSIASMHHFVKHGGPEMVVYRVSPPEVESGVRVGDLTYPGYAMSGLNPDAKDPSLKAAFFALLHDQDLNARIELYARDDAGNETRVPFDHRVFPRPFKKSRIEVNDQFLQRVVPEILEHSPELKLTVPESADEYVQAYVKINSDLRRMNGEKIAALAKQTSPQWLARGEFQQMTNSQVESSFADYRTYFHNGKEIDRQVHLGFDLAATAAVEVKASNRGKVLYADYLGIYGNCIILDHGMGVQSLYAHLSSMDVQPGQTVEKNQVLGRSGMTGLAGGDHLHFTMLLQGRAVHPVEWWDPHWIEDRVMRKVREATGAPANAVTQHQPSPGPAVASSR